MWLVLCGLLVLACLRTHPSGFFAITALTILATSIVMPQPPPPSIPPFPPLQKINDATASSARVAKKEEDETTAEDSQSHVPSETRHLRPGHLMMTSQSSRRLKRALLKEFGLV